jgi:hypothetical protein
MGTAAKPQARRNEKAELQPVKFILKFCGQVESACHAKDQSGNPGVIFQTADHFGFPVSNSGKLA